ncbi:MAG: hypothetical protein DKT66_04745 [Candidatus Melainabacteria bacterium]|nr:MAG: hypothetical protein DKT66_04745 [Candidatus Melainabacteria bacterium]
MSTSGSSFLQKNATPTPSTLGGNPPAVAQQENLESRRLFQHIGLPPMARSLPSAGREDIFAPPATESEIENSPEQNCEGTTETFTTDAATPETVLAASQETAVEPTQTNAVAALEPADMATFVPPQDGKVQEVSTPTSLFKQPSPEKIDSKQEKRYDIPFHQHEKDILIYLSDFTKSPEFKPFQNPRSRRSLTNNDGATVVEELAQDFSTRNLTTRKDSSSEQVRDRLGRLVYEKFQDGQKWTARFLFYHDQNGKKSPFVQSLKSLSSDGRFREVQYSKLGQVESEKETLYDLKMAI